MTNRAITILALGLLMAVRSRGEPPGRDEGGVAETRKIEALIAVVEGLGDAAFIRNGAEHDCRAAAKHMRDKWEARRSDIHTARDFIRIAASASSMSGQPYRIRFRDGREITSGAFLARELQRMERGAASASQAASAPAHDGYALVWSDEFDEDGPPNPRNWIFETGFVRNHEAQWYRHQNVRCEGGRLVIEARRERVENPNYDAGASDWRGSRPYAEYTSGSIKTMGRHAWTFGRFEMRARIDTREGLWPAFWMVGTRRDWPGCGEIDIMEYYRGLLLANAAWAGTQRWQAVWDDSKTPIGQIAGKLGIEAWSKAFHIWRMDWDAAHIRLSVDGRPLNEIDLSRTINATPDKANPLREPQHIILNLAVGGTSGGDPSKTEFPARFEVDWVRVYQRSP